MGKNIKYSEPASYFPKEIRDKFNKTNSSGKKTTTNKTADSGKKNKK